jgi:hypothetical protein
MVNRFRTSIALVIGVTVGGTPLVAAIDKPVRTESGLVMALKTQGVSAADAAAQLSTEFKAKYPDWPSMNVRSFGQSIYSE